MPVFEIGTFFLLGLIVGSFLNVVVSRLHLGESLLGRSRCPQCRRLIHWYDNIPLLSFVILQARCRDCETKISWQYPLVEFSTGALFALLGWKLFMPGDFSSVIELFFALFAASVLVVIFVYDLRFMEIPTTVIWIGFFGLLVYTIDKDLRMGSGNLLSGFTANGLLAAVGAFLFFYALSRLSQERWMGKGDAYAALVVGVLVGWPMVVVALMLAFVIGAAAGVALVLLGKKKMQSRIPFAPFLVAGALVMFLFGDEIIQKWWM